MNIADDRTGGRELVPFRKENDLLARQCGLDDRGVEPLRHAFSYEVPEEVDAEGDHVRGKRLIDADEVIVVRRI
jgi:hypothetical protein